MINSILNFIAGALLLNWFVPYLSLIIVIFTFKKLLLRKKVAGLSKFVKCVLFILMFSISHALIIILSLLIMMLFSNTTGVIYWAA